MAKTRRNSRFEPDCKKIEEEDYVKLLEMFKEYNNSLAGEFKEATILTSDGVNLPFLGAGAFNRVFLDKDLVCKGDQFIVRIERRPHQNPSQRPNPFSRMVNLVRKKITRKNIKIIDK